MISFSFSQAVLLFVGYSMLGWACESVWCSAGTKKLVNRGFLTGPWCPVYGFGAILLLLMGQPFAAHPVLVFLLAVVSTSLLEYFTGWLLEALFKTRWWDYSKRKFQIKGRVCLRNSLLFGLLGLAVVYGLQPLAKEFLLEVPQKTARLIASGLMVIWFFDLLHALAATTALQARLEGIREKLKAGQSVGAEEAQKATGLRLLKAYPRLHGQEFLQELEALKTALDGHYIRRKERVKSALAKQKASAVRSIQGVKASYQGVTVTRMVWVFMLGSVLGYVIETIYCLITRGVLESRQGMVYGPFNQVYGFGAVCMVLLLTPLTRKGDGGVFLGGAVVGGLFEALCSWVQEIVFGSVSWEYSGQTFSFFGGRTSLTFMFFWGVLAVVYMKFIYPKMAAWIDRIPKRPKATLTWMISVGLVLNMALSAVAVGRWSARVQGAAPRNAVETWLDAHYPDDMLEEIYPSMHFVEAKQ